MTGKQQPPRAIPVLPIPIIIGQSRGICRLAGSVFPLADWHGKDGELLRDILRHDKGEPSVLGPPGSQVPLGRILWLSS